MQSLITKGNVRPKTERERERKYSSVDSPQQREEGVDDVQQRLQHLQVHGVNPANKYLQKQI